MFPFTKPASRREPYLAGADHSDRCRIRRLNANRAPSAWHASAMARRDTLVRRILAGTSDADIRFDELRRLLQRLGFEERVRGSHHLFRRGGIEERINLQRDDAKAKPYQVCQVRDVLVRYRLAGEDG